MRVPIVWMVVLSRKNVYIAILEKSVAVVLKKKIIHYKTFQKPIDKPSQVCYNKDNDEGNEGKPH